MVQQMVTPADINEINAKFWRTESKKAEQRMRDPAVRDIALARVASDFKRYMSAGDQISLEAALTEAEQSKRQLERGFARRGGRAVKSDPLQDFILAALRIKPNITAPQLLDDLKRAAQPGGPIEEVDDEVIAFIDVKDKRRSMEKPEGHPIRKGNGGRKPQVVGRSARISGLKDRLSRARKKLKSIAESRSPDSAIAPRQTPGG
jgi:hypothetical protein